MQAAFQKYTDNAVSKTVNLPHDAQKKDVKEIYTMAYNLGCKGVTIYRDQSKADQVLSFSNKSEQAEQETSSPTHDSAPAITSSIVADRPETLTGFTTRIKTGMGQLYVTVNELNGLPFEVFGTIGRSGKSTTAKTEAIGRLVSLALRSGVDVHSIIEQIKGIGGEHAVFQKGGRVLSIPDAISKVLEKRYGLNGNSVQTATLTGDFCPECGGTVVHEEGCKTCHACGYSKCG